MKQNISSPPLTEDEYRLCVRVAKLYYDADMTQDEIGKRLGY
jgi:DNA-binding transcriptional regulator LsrR (DeoR family)